MTILIDGKKVAEKILEPVKKEIGQLKKQGITPTLAIILVGEDPQSLIYIREKSKKATEIGIKLELFRFPTKAKSEKIERLIKKLNRNPKTHGIMLQLPLPPHLNSDKIIAVITPQKDVDGLIEKSPYPPACAAGIMEILAAYKIPVKGKKVVILGAGRLVGRPLYSLMNKAGAAAILCSSLDKNALLTAKRADILIGAIPIEDCISKKMVKKNACVIDAAKNVKNEVREIAAYLTPKIGGVGPVTVAILMKNVIRAAKVDKRA